MTPSLEYHFHYNPSIASHQRGKETVERCLKVPQLNGDLTVTCIAEAKQPALFVIIEDTPRLFPGPFDDYFILSFLEAMHAISK
jgi:hypothetical protein